MGSSNWSDVFRLWMLAPVGAAAILAVQSAAEISPWPWWAGLLLLGLCWALRWTVFGLLNDLMPVQDFWRRFRRAWRDTRTVQP